MTYAQIKAAEWAALLDDLRPALGGAKTLEEATQVVVRRIYEALPETTVLVRAYALVPYQELGHEVRTFVDTLTKTTDITRPVIQATTPVLSLLASHGAKPEWRDRKLSRGHKGIPLVSAEFVDAIPMLARLLKELGIDLAWLDDAPEATTRRLLGGFNGVFYVEDARTVRDAKGRLVIPATDFVAEESVRTVFGMGGFYPDGTMIVAIVFTREILQRSVVERFASLVSMMKGETFRLIMKRRFFDA